MTETGSTTDAERRSMMRSMMEQCLSGMSAEDRKEMCSAMMGMMSEKMSGESGGASCGMPGGMSGMMSGGHEGQMAQMPEMMLKTMMPHCIGMMLPSIDADERGGIAAGILAALLENGTVGMSDGQARSFREALDKVLRADQESKP